jgi:hypothetical protein
MATTSTLLLLGGLVLLAGTAHAQAPLFSPVVTYPAGNAPRNLVVGDVNNDGKIDVLTANQNGSAVGVLLGMGNGTFQTVTTYSTGAASNPSDIAVADVNGDGRLDLLTANYGSNSAGVLLGNGNGTFQAAVAFATGATGGAPVGIAVTDITGDGKLDLITANSFGYNISVFAGTGTGTFQTPVNYALGPTAVPLDVTVADLNADGRPEVLVASAGSNTVTVLTGLGGGNFQPGPYPVGLGASFTPFGVAAGDVTGDGRPDVVTANSGNSTVSVLLNQGTSFGTATSFQNSGAPASIAVADLNQDGQADLITANPGDPAIAVLLGNGNGTFQPFSKYLANTGNQPSGLVVADVNGDGKPDVLTANVGGTIGVLLNATATIPLASQAALPGASATLHPNPTADHATLALAGLPASVAQVQATLLDATGRAVRQCTLAASQGHARAEVPTAGLAPGLYVLRLAAFNTLGKQLGALPAQRLSVR